MAIAFTSSGYSSDYIKDLNMLTDLAGTEEAKKLREKICDRVDKRINFESRRQLFQLLKITYDGDLGWLKRDIAKIALLDLGSIDGLDKVQRFLYVIWNNGFDGLREELIQNLEQLWEIDWS